MPSKKALAWSELKVGALIIVCLTILSAIVVLVLGVESPFAARYTLYTYLPNIGGLRTDTPVMLEGVTVGAVDSYEFASQLEKGIRVHLRVQKKYQDRIRTDSIAKLRSLGLLGDKYIEITQGTSQGRPLKEGDSIAGAPPVDLDQMIAQGTHTFDNVSDTVINFKTLTDRLNRGEGTIGRLLTDDQLYTNMAELTRKINKGEGSIGSFLNDRSLYNELNTTASNFRKVSQKVEGGEGLAGKLLSDSKVAASFESTITRLETVVARLDKGEGSLGKLSIDPALYNNLNQVSANLKPVTSKINQGQGTVGKLFHDQQLYDNSNKVMAELLLLVKDIRKDPKKYLRIKFSIF